MMQKKDTVTPAEFDPEAFEVGDVFTAEVGDYTGTGFSYNSGKAEIDYLVVEVNEDGLTVVSYKNRLDWNTQTADHEGHEETITSDGRLENAEWNESRFEPWNAAVKDYTRKPGRGGEHMIREGLVGSGRK